MFDFFKKTKKPDPPKYVWVGIINGIYVNDFKENVEQSRVTFNLFEASTGERKYIVSGNTYGYEYHRVYGRIIVPFINGCNLDYISKQLDEYNIDFWKEKGYDISKLVNNPVLFNKPKTNNVLKLVVPEPSEDEDTAGS